MKSVIYTALVILCILAAVYDFILGEYAMSMSCSAMCIACLAIYHSIIKK